MAKHDSDIPPASDAERRPSVEDGPVPDAHRGEPEPRPDAHTRPAPEADMTRPDQQEELGPVEGLFHASAVEAEAELTDDPEAEREADRLGIESEGVEAAQIFSIMLATGITLALAVVGVFFLVAYFSDAETVERSSGALYPEIAENRNRATDLLTNYGRTDDVYRIPITEAMGLVVADYAAQGRDLRPAPENFRTMYQSGYFDDSGFRPPVPGAEGEEQEEAELGEVQEAPEAATPDALEPAPADEPEETEDG